MGKYKEVYITIEQFAELQNRDEFYEGFVIGYGYAFVSFEEVPPPNLNGFRHDRQDISAEHNRSVMVKVQLMDMSSEAVRSSLNETEPGSPDNPDYDDSAQKLYERYSKFNLAMSGLTSAAEGSKATFRLFDSFGRWSFKFYSNGWKGNQYVTPVQLAKVGKGLGIGLVAISVVVDIYGVVNYKNGNEGSYKVSPYKASINTIMGAYTIRVSGLLGLGYFLVDEVIGMDNVIGAGALVRQEHRKAVGDTYDKWWFPKEQFPK